MKSLGKVVLPLGIVVFGFFLVIGMSMSKKAPLRIAQEDVVNFVETVTLMPEEVQLEVLGKGTVRASQEAIITSTVSGLVVYVAPDFRLGEFISGPEQGEKAVLVRLDAKPLLAQKTRVEADLQIARSRITELDRNREYLQGQQEVCKRQLELAQKEYNRLQTLGSKNATAMNALETAEANLLNHKKSLMDVQIQIENLPVKIIQAKAEIEKATSDLAMVNRDIEHTEIKTPFASQVVYKSVEVGSYVQTGTVLGKLVGVDAYEIALSITPEDLNKLPSVPAGALPEFARDPEFLGNPKATVQWLSYGSRYTWQGEVIRLEPMDNKTRTFPLVVEIKNPWLYLAQKKGMPLMLGSFCEVRVEGEKLDWMQVPESALHEEDTVHLLRDGRLVIAPVHIVHRAQGKAVIQPGNASPDLAIIYGMQRETTKIKAKEGMAFLQKQLSPWKEKGLLEFVEFPRLLFSSFRITDNSKDKEAVLKELESFVNSLKIPEGLRLALLQRKGYFPCFGFGEKIITSKLRYPVPGMPLQSKGDVLKPSSHKEEGR